MNQVCRAGKIKITPEMRRTVFLMAFAGHPGKDIALMIDMNKNTFDKKKARDTALRSAYDAGRHYYFEWVKLKRCEHKYLGKPKIKGNHIGLIPLFETKKTFHEIMMASYIPPSL